MRRLRERRAAALEPGGPPGLRDAAGVLAPAVEAAVTALEPCGKDAGAVQLARRYAAVIDQAESPGAALRAFGPSLLKVLEALGGTPAARAAAGQAVAAKAAPSRLEALRQASAEACGRPRG